MRRIVPTEHQEQVALFQWAALEGRFDQRLHLMFAIPNGGHRHPVVAAKLKAEGVQSGVPDIFLPVPANGYHGLWIELKRIGGKPTDNQLGWKVALEKQGYAAHICEGMEYAISVIRDYLR